MASATSADCAWSWVSCWASAAVRCSARLRTSHVARRGVKGWATGSATTGRRWRRPWRRGGRRWDRDRQRPIRERHGLLARRAIDGVEGLVLRGKDLVQRLRQVLDEMKPIGDLGGSRGPLPCPFCIGARPIPGDYLYPGML